MAAGDRTVRRVGPNAVVALPAEIDADNADKISHELLATIGLGAAVVVIDMSATTFCDSAGIQAIITAYRHAAANGTQLRLVATTVLRILTLVGADQIVSIYPTLDAALAGTPSAQASTPDRGHEPAGTTIGGDLEAQTPPAED
jgi:anti-sigma B factor antagonist